MIFREYVELFETPTLIEYNVLKYTGEVSVNEYNDKREKGAIPSSSKC